GSAHLLAQPVPSGEIAHERLLEDGDGIGQQRIASGALSERDALVEPVQRLPGFDAGRATLPAGGARCDVDLDILKIPGELIRLLVDRISVGLFERVPIHAPLPLLQPRLCVLYGGCLGFWGKCVANCAYLVGFLVGERATEHRTQPPRRSSVAATLVLAVDAFVSQRLWQGGLWAAERWACTGASGAAIGHRPPGAPAHRASQRWQRSAGAR